MCWVGVIERKRGVRERERESRQCGQLLSAMSYVATQASIQTRPIHYPYGPLQCLMCSMDPCNVLCVPWTLAMSYVFCDIHVAVCIGCLR